MAVAAGPRARLPVETQVETEEGVPVLTAGDLATIARCVGSGSAVLEGAISTAPTLGRFAFNHTGSERVACFLCGSRAMVKWCWHDRATSPQHLQKHDAAVAGALVESAPDPADIVASQHERSLRGLAWK